MSEAPVRRRDRCRLCDSRELALAFALTPTPPANAFVPPSRKDEKQEAFPLDVMFCNACAHVQLAHVVDPRVLFEDYVYVSGTSPSFVKHFEDYAAAVGALASLKHGALAVDIGSNDGTLLRAFAGKFGARVLGIDPARGIAQAATAAGIETWPEFFSVALAEKIVAGRGRASVVTANNVFAHIDDLAGVVEGVRTLLAPDGVFALEVSYLLDVVEKTLFDTIYHEHLSYHSVVALQPFLRRHGMELIEVVRVGSHGGSLRAIAQPAGGPRPVGASVAELIALERARGIDKIGALHALSRQIDALGKELRGVIADARKAGKSIAGFGAPAKATTLMYHFGVGASDLGYVVDDSPLKRGLLTPGLHIPVVAPSHADGHPPDYFLVLAWNFASQIIAKNEKHRQRGGRFIVPVPKVEVV